MQKLTEKNIGDYNIVCVTDAIYSRELKIARGEEISLSKDVLISDINSWLSQGLIALNEKKKDKKKQKK